MRYVLALICFFLMPGMIAAKTPSFKSTLPAKDNSLFLQTDSVAEIDGDTLENPVDIPSIPTLFEGSTVGYNDDYDASCPGDNSVAPDFVFRLNLTQNMSLILDLCGSSFDTKIYIMNKSREVLHCNDDFYFDDECGFYTSKLTTDLLFADQTYFVIVDGHGNQSGNFVLDISAQAPFLNVDCAFDDTWWAFDEGEPPLNPDYVDDFNGSCSTAVYFDGQQYNAMSFHGQTGWMEEGRRDTDWFYLDTTGTEETELTFRATYPTNLFLMEMDADCDDLYVEQIHFSQSCEPVTIILENESYFQHWMFVVAPYSFSPFDQSIWGYDYLLETSGTIRRSLDTSADKGRGCPLFPAGSWSLSANLDLMSNDYQADQLGCLENIATNGEDAVVEIYLEAGHEVWGFFRPRWYNFPNQSMPVVDVDDLTSLYLVDDLRLGAENCILSASSFDEYFSATVEESGFYYFVLDSGNNATTGSYFRFVNESEIPMPPPDSICDGAENIGPGNHAILGDLTYSQNSYDPDYLCGGGTPRNHAIGDTGRDIAYRLDFMAGQVLDFHM